MRDDPNLTVLAPTQIIAIDDRRLLQNFAIAPKRSNEPIDIQIDIKLIAIRGGYDTVRVATLRAFNNRPTFRGRPLSYMTNIESKQRLNGGPSLVTNKRRSAEKPTTRQTSYIVHQFAIRRENTASPDQSKGHTVGVNEELEELDRFTQTMIHHQQLPSLIGFLTQIDAMKRHFLW